MKSAANRTFDERLFACLLCRTRSTIGFSEEKELFLIGGQLVIILIGDFDETETLPKKEPARLIIRFDKLNQSTNTEVAV